jgi:ribose 5-phosphate isomerase A
MAADLSPIDQAKFVAARRSVDFVERRHETGPWHRLDGGLDGALPGRTGAEEGLSVTCVATSSPHGGAGAQLGLKVVGLDETKMAGSDHRRRG